MHRITVLRRLAGLSQRGLAAKSGVAQSNIAAAESGAEPLSAEAAMKVGRALDEDGLSLYLSTTVASLKTAIERGEERPIRAAHIARALIQILETADLTPQQRAAARNAARQLVDLATAAAERSGAGTLSGLAKKSGGPGPLDPPQREAERRQEMMDHLGRDAHGRLLAEDVTDKTLGKAPEQPKKKLRPEDPDAAVSGSDATYAYKFAKRGDDLGRDGFGRQKGGT